jgi:hypothetical protein
MVKLGPGIPLVHRRLAFDRDEQSYDDSAVGDLDLAAFLAHPANQLAGTLLELPYPYRLHAVLLTMSPQLWTHYTIKTFAID